MAIIHTYYGHCTLEWFIHICHLTILFACLYYIKLLVGEEGGGSGLGGGGSKYYSHYKMTHPNCRIQDVTSHVLFVH